MRPAPKTGVGILKIRLLLAACVAKSGWAREQPPAPVRPVIVAVLCTPPSLVPSELNLNRASRTGPFDVMKNGIVSVPPSFEANATCGFTNGLVPPVAGLA